MIYTTHPMINRRSIGKGPKPRPAGENASATIFEKGPKEGMKRAAIRHITPGFGRRRNGPRGAKCLFSRRILQCGADSPARMRGDINESAEI
jgi:hypothetical protein